MDSDLPCRNPKTLVNPFKKMIKKCCSNESVAVAAVDTWAIIIYEKTP
jgi:Ulp1 family protease